MWSNVVTGRSIPGAVLAHQGGWDEILLVAGPMAFVAFLLWLAKRRVTRAGKPVTAPAEGEAGTTAGRRPPPLSGESGAG